MDPKALAEHLVAKAPGGKFGEPYMLELQGLRDLLGAYETDAEIAAATAAFQHRLEKLTGYCASDANPAAASPPRRAAPQPGLQALLESAGADRAGLLGPVGRDRGAAGRAGPAHLGHYQGSDRKRRRQSSLRPDDRRRKRGLARRVGRALISGGGRDASSSAGRPRPHAPRNRVCRLVRAGRRTRNLLSRGRPRAICRCVRSAPSG